MTESKKKLSAGQILMLIATAFMMFGGLYPIIGAIGGCLIYGRDRVKGAFIGAIIGFVVLVTSLLAGPLFTQ
jgi:hypothetical protein